MSVRNSDTAEGSRGTTPWWIRHFDWVGAGFVFLVTQIVYLLTVTVSCPFWDSGEYIATSHILGIPHPPGTPLYLLMGRVFSLLPLFDLVATRINYFSALAAGLTAMFNYLITVEIYRRWHDRGELTSAVGTSGTDSAAAPTAGPRATLSALGPSRWIQFCAGSVAAYFTAFGRTFWDNAIEAEVYALGSMIMALAVWLILRWGRPGNRSLRTGLFILLYYVLCLSMGIHLGTFLVLPGIVLYAWLVDRRIFAAGPISSLFVAGLVIGLHPGLLPTLGWVIWGVMLLAPVIVLSIVSMVRRPLHPSLGARGILTWCAAAAILGISTHAYLMIRAHLNPGINEADPRTWDALWKVLIRDQYKPPNPFEVRQAPWSVQFDRHFFQYAKDQYALGLAPAWFGYLLPYLLGGFGVVRHWLRDRRSFALIGSIYLITSVGMVFYLNFRTEEVRERDYFFVASFQFFAIWIGLGAAGLLETFRAARDERRGVTQALFATAGVLTMALPLLTMKHYWFTHDRTEFHVAADYAYNMLTSLEPNALLLTNGDNDTFPLWYIQEVEGYRKDVRVVNLSLLNTDWYLRQIRDNEPKVDLGWTDSEILLASDFTVLRAMADANYGGWTKSRLETFLKQNNMRQYVRSLDEPLITKDLAVARIIEREYGKRPLYLAVTVPDVMGLEERMLMEGLVYRITDPVPGQTDRIDVDATLHNLREVYRYRGLVGPDGKHDFSVYKDENSTRLSQNYSAAYVHAADEMLRSGRAAEANEAIASAIEISPRSRSILSSLGILYLRARDFARSESMWIRIVESGQADALTYRYLGRTKEAQGDLEGAELSYRMALASDPEDRESAIDLFSFQWEVQGKRQEAVLVLENWLRANPSDAEIGAAYRQYQDSLAILSR